MKKYSISVSCLGPGEGVRFIERFIKGEDGGEYDTSLDDGAIYVDGNIEVTEEVLTEMKQWLEIDDEDVQYSIEEGEGIDMDGYFTVRIEKL